MKILAAALSVGTESRFSIVTIFFRVMGGKRDSLHHIIECGARVTMFRLFFPLYPVEFQLRKHLNLLKAFHRMFRNVFFSGN